MFVFLLALKHPDTANNFARVEQLLATTLHSICGQTNPNFRVVVVCNQLPNLDIDDSRVHFHVVDFPPVSKKDGRLHPVEKFTDKGTKYLSGLLFAKQFNPSYVYIVDSDDWVNKDVVEYFQHAKPYPVWCVDKGYFVNIENKEYKKRSGLLRYCGSTFAYQYDFLIKEAGIKKDIDQSSTQQALIDATSEYFVITLLSNHTVNYQYFKDKGFEPKAIPMRTSCWIQGTGENVSLTAGGDAGLPIDQAFCQRFNLPATFLSPKPQSLLAQIRDFLASMQSGLTWQYSRITGKRLF